MKSKKNLKVVVVDTNLQQRGRLRDSITLQLFQPQVSCFANLAEAIAYFSGPSFDILFIGAPENFTELRNTLNVVKKSEHDDLDPRVCLTVAPTLQTNAYIAEALVCGTDGFLFEPYAAEHLEKLIDILSTNHAASSEEASPTASGVLRQLLVDPTGSKSPHSKPLNRLMALARQHGDLAPMMKLEAFHVILHEKFLRSLLKDQRPLHPGELIKLMIDTGGQSYHSVSDVSGLSVEEVAGLCAGTIDLNESMAERLSRTLGESKHYWLSLQKEYIRYHD